jgi:hypothetical protein
MVHERVHKCISQRVPSGIGKVTQLQPEIICLHQVTCCLHYILKIRGKRYKRYKESYKSNDSRRGESIGKGAGLRPRRNARGRVDGAFAVAIAEVSAGGESKYFLLTIRVAALEGPLCWRLTPWVIAGVGTVL